MDTTKQSRYHTSMLIVSMLVFGTIGVFVRHIDLPSGEIALYRAVMAAVLIAGFLVISREGFGIGAVRRALPLLLFSGAAMGFNWILLFEAYRYTTVSVATLSYYFAPILVMVACPLLFREKLGVLQGVCFVMATVGIVLITGLGDLASKQTHGIGVLFGLGAAVLYATVILVNKYITEVTGICRTFWQFLAAIAVLLPYVMSTGGFTIGSLDGKGWAALLILGIVHTGVAYCLYFSAMRKLTGQKIAILSYIDPLTAVILSATVLNEPMGAWQVVGGVLILVFTLLSERKPK